MSFAASLSLIIIINYVLTSCMQVKVVSSCHIQFLLGRGGGGFLLEGEHSGGRVFPL